jgi:MtN3 and saliva related transmembrane protein
MSIDIIGYIATGILAIAFIPQSIRIWQTKSVKDISLMTFSMVFMSTILWMYYAYAKQDWPILVVNGVLFFTQGSILLCKVMYGKD